MLKVNNKIYLSWDDAINLVDKLCEKIITELPNIDSVFGLKRGGLIPAVMLSHLLNIPFTYEISKNTLIVDDICDSGETFIKLYEKHPDAIYSCLHFKPHTSRFFPKLKAMELNSDDWIVYPWERDDSETIQDYLK